MKRRMAMLAAVTVVSGIVTMLSPSTSPAQAAIHGACAGTGNAHLDDTLFYPVPQSAPKSANFTFHLNGLAAACVTTNPPGTTTTGPSATGTVHGWCGLSVGSGTLTGGGSFSWIGIGSMLIVTGEVSGVVNATPNIPGGDLCSSGADDFLITGVAVQKSCTPTPPTSVPVTIPTGPTGSVHICNPTSTTAII
jgi:hypothetical protein